MNIRKVIRITPYTSRGQNNKIKNFNRDDKKLLVLITKNIALIVIVLSVPYFPLYNGGYYSCQRNI